MRHSTLRRNNLTISGVRSPLIESGPPNDPEAVVFCHGNPGSRLDWEDLVSRSGEFVRAVAFDLPGFGEADKPRGFDDSVTGYTRFLADALAQLGIDRVHLVVHDIGGWHGQQWAGLNPEAFRSMVLINTPPVVNYRWYLLAKIWRTPIAGELLQSAMNRPFIDRMWRDFDSGTRHAILELYRATDVLRIASLPSETFRRLARPARVVWGKQDPYIPLRFAEAHREIYPGLDYAYLERSGHWPFMDDPDGVADPVLEFLRKQTSRS